MKFTEGLDADLRSGLLEQIRILWTHGSNAIEGNTLTLSDTQLVLEYGLTIGGKTVREHTEIIGHAKAIDKLYELVYNPKMDEGDLMALHRLLMPGEDFSGMWKQQYNGTTVPAPGGVLQRHNYPAPIKIPDLMAAWMDEFHGYMTKAESSSADELIIAHADLHLSFARIHPFQDGNGRMARLLSNMPIIKGGLPPILYSMDVRARYIRLLQDYTLAHGRPGSDGKPLNTKDAHFECWRDLCHEQFSKSLNIIMEFQNLQSERNSDHGSVPEKDGRNTAIQAETVGLIKKAEQAQPNAIVSMPDTPDTVNPSGPKPEDR